MNNKENFIENTAPCKNKLSDIYNYLLIDNDNSCSLNNELISQSQSYATIMNCTQIVAYNSTTTVLHWTIETLDGTLIYRSQNSILYHAMILNLDNLSIIPNSQLSLNAITADGDKYSITIEYVPNYNTIYYDFIDYHYSCLISYITMIPSPLCPPILECSSVSVSNHAVVLTKFELRIADTNETIYSSKRYLNGKTWTKKLSDLSILPGTKLKLHAGVIAGKDSEPYLIIKYNPDNFTTASKATFELWGTTSHTEMYYRGLDLTI